MKNRMKRFFWAGSLLMLLVFPTGVFAYDGILSFGDSLTDNGVYGTSNGTTTNTSPNDYYGIQYFTSGPVWVENMASHYSVPLLDMAYGGATTGMNDPAVAYLASQQTPPNLPLEYIGNNALGLQWQVGTAYLGTVSSPVSPVSLGLPASVSSSVPSNTLVTVWGGANDFLNYVMGQNGITPSGTIPSNAAAAALNVATAIQLLANSNPSGGLYFLVPNLPNIGQTPEFTSLGGVAQLAATAYSQDFNAYLLADLYNLAGTYQNDTFYTLDTYDLLDNLIGNKDYFASYGSGYDFTNVTDSGYGTPGYLFWDGIHPSAEGQALLGYLAENDAQLVQTKTPEPTTMILYGVGFAGAGLYRRMRRKIKN